MPCMGSDLCHGARIEGSAELQRQPAAGDSCPDICVVLDFETCLPQTVRAAGVSVIHSSDPHCCRLTDTSEEISIEELEDE